MVPKKLNNSVTLFAVRPIMYIILHSLNSICKTSLVDIKLPVSVVLEWWSSIGRNLATVEVYNSVLILTDTSQDYHFLFFFTMLHVSRSFFMVELEYLEAKVILWSHSGNWPDCHVYDHVYMQSREVIFLFFGSKKRVRDRNNALLLSQLY